MSWSDGQCPWGYGMRNVDMMPTCVYTGLADAPYTEAEWSEILYGPSPAQIAGPVMAPHSMGSMNVSAELTPGQKGQAFDYTWLLYGGIALVVIMALGKGK